MTTFLSDIVLAGANDIQFKNTSGANTGKIESDGNNLVLSNAVGDILLGDGASDVYIGDGTNNVNILFEQSGSIKAEDGSSGVTLTLGSGDTTLALGSSISSAATVLGALTVGVDDTGHDVKFFGATSGAYMLWDESEDGLVITHPAGDAGLEIYTVSGTAPSSPQFKVGRSSNEYFAVYTEDRTTHLIHRQDETDSGAMYTSSELWGGGSGNDSWTWKHGTNTGGSLATVMTLDKAGQLTITGEIEGGSLDINGNADISGTLTLGGDVTIINSIIHAGDTDTYFGFHNADEWRVVTGGTERFEITNSGATFAGSVTATSLDINGAADISGALTGVDALTMSGILTVDSASAAQLKLDSATGNDSVVSFQQGGTNKMKFGFDHDVSKFAMVFGTGAFSTAKFTLDGSAMQLDTTLTVGVDDTGHDVKFFGATSGKYMLWDESDDALQFPDNTKIKFGTGNDFQLYHSGSNAFLTNTVGDINIINNTDNADIVFQSDDGAGGVATYFKLDGSLATHDGSATTNLYTVWPDLSNITLGSSQDFSMKHDGTDTIFNNQTGNFVLRNSADDKDIIFQSDDGSGGVKSYFYLDGSIGATIVPDSTSLGFGTGGDMYINHDATNSNITNFTGDLYITNKANDKDVVLQSDDGSGGHTPYLTLDGSATNIYVQKNLKLADDVLLQIGDSGDLNLNTDGSHGYISNVTGNLYVRNQADDGDIIFESDDGSGGVATYFFLDGGSVMTQFNERAMWLDNKAAEFGSSRDLQIYHNATDSVIDNLTGDFYISQKAADKDLIFRADDGAGGYTPYLTLDGGLGFTTIQKHVRWEDGIIARFGNSDDGSLYHSGGHFYMGNNTGDIIVTNTTDDGDIIFQSDDGSGGTATYFYLDGSSATNIFSKDVLLSDNISLKIGNAADMKLYHDGSNSYINQQGTGDLYLRQNTDDGDIIFQSDDGSGGLATYLTLDGSAAETKVDKDMRFSDNVNLRIGTNSDVVIVHDNSNFTTTNYTGNYNIINQQVDGDIVFQTDDGSGGVETYLTIDGGSQEIIATKPIVTGESQIKVLPHHFMSNEDGGANKSAQFRDDTIIGVRTSADSAELYAFVEIPYGKTARTVTVYGNDTSLVVNVYESDINAGALTDKTPGAGCVVGTACDITDVAYSATNYLVIKVTTVSYTNDIVYGAVVTIG